MGVVYRATDLALDRHVAVKLIAPALADDPAFRRRFVSESKVAASLDHPNVIPIHHAGEQDGVLFQVMRYVEGEDLRALLRREGRLEPERAAPIVAAVAAALDAAHARGLVHRDVKPANVLLDAKRHVYLTDFGLSVRLGGIDDSRPGRAAGHRALHLARADPRRGDRRAHRRLRARRDALPHAHGRGAVPRGQRRGAAVGAPLRAAARAEPRRRRHPGRLRRRDRARHGKDPAHRYASAGDLSRAALAAVGEPPAPPPAAPADDRRALAKRALADPFSLAAAGAIVLAGRDLRRPRPGPAAGARRLPRRAPCGPTSTTTCARPCARRSSRRARPRRRAGWRRRSSCCSARRRRPGPRPRRDRGVGPALHRGRRRGRPARGDHARRRRARPAAARGAARRPAGRGRGAARAGQGGERPGQGRRSSPRSATSSRCSGGWRRSSATSTPRWTGC